MILIYKMNKVGALKGVLCRRKPPKDFRGSPEKFYFAADGGKILFIPSYLCIKNNAPFSR